MDIIATVTKKKIVIAVHIHHYYINTLRGKHLSSHFSSDLFSFSETIEISCKGGIWKTSIGWTRVSYMVISEYKNIEIRRGPERVLLASETSFIECFHGPRNLFHARTKTAYPCCAVFL